MPPGRGVTRVSNTHDPARKRSRWRVSKKVRLGKAKTEAEAVCEPFDKQTLDGAAPAESTPPRGTLTKSLKDMAPLLWESSFLALLAEEREFLAQSGLTAGAIALKSMAPVSSYRQRGLQRHPERSQAIEGLQGHAMAARAMRQGNQMQHVFSICARSIASLAHRVPKKEWTELLLERAVLSRTTTTKLVKFMTACRPRPSFSIMKGVAYHIFDQTFAKKGASRGKHRAAERVDASGALVELIDMVLINSMSIPLPHVLGGGLDNAELNHLYTTGPYVKPFTNILPHVHPDRVKASTYNMMKEV